MNKMNKINIKDGDTIDIYGFSFQGDLSLCMIVSPIFIFEENMDITSFYEEVLCDLCNGDVIGISSTEKEELEDRFCALEDFAKFAISCFETPNDIFIPTILEDLNVGITEVLKATVKFTYVEESDSFDFSADESTTTISIGKVCGECDLNCLECPIPTYDPEYCEYCMREAEENGFEYEPNFTHVNGYWTCENCKRAV